MSNITADNFRTSRLNQKYIVKKKRGRKKPFMEHKVGNCSSYFPYDVVSIRVGVNAFNISAIIISILDAVRHGVLSLVSI